MQHCFAPYTLKKFYGILCQIQRIKELNTRCLVGALTQLHVKNEDCGFIPKGMLYYICKVGRISQQVTAIQVCTNTMRHALFKGMMNAHGLATNAFKGANLAQIH